MSSCGTLEMVCLGVSIGLLLFFSIEDARKNKKDEDE